MALISEKEYFEIESRTTQEGTLENPIISKVPQYYRIAEFLGYKRKYDLYWESDKRVIHIIYKKSHRTFNFWWDLNNWNFIIKDILPIAYESGLMEKKLEKYILKGESDKFIQELNNRLLNGIR